jgi:hypothetical protein
VSGSQAQVWVALHFSLKIPAPAGTQYIALHAKAFFLAGAFSRSKITMKFDREVSAQFPYC